MMEKMDLVYIVKDGAENEELKYSLRSVEKNMKFRKVWIFGGKPVGIEPDEFVPLGQAGETEYERTRNLMYLISSYYPKLSDNFILMNDDFFAMKSLADLKCAHRGSIYEQIVKVEMKHHNIMNPYTLELRKNVQLLDGAGFDEPLSFELHRPMVFNKDKLSEVLTLFPDATLFRSLYGNYYGLGEERVNDGKITSLSLAPDGEKDFLSTTETSFKSGKVGEYIRAQFPEQSKYERAGYG
jgi:hypothetical protein